MKPKRLGELKKEMKLLNDNKDKMCYIDISIVVGWIELRLKIEIIPPVN